ncbi:MAG: hypothetical protein ACOYNZ_07780 [Rhodoferax sp.]
MKKSTLAMLTAVMLLMVTGVSAGPPRGGGVYHGGGGHHRGHPAWGGGHWGSGVGIYYGGLGLGWGYGYPYAYGYPYSYAPIVINAEAMPQVLIQQDVPVGAAAQNEPSTGYWYYCTQPAGYFPYVQDCSQPWMKVVPQIPSNQPAAPRAVP